MGLVGLVKGMAIELENIVANTVVLKARAGKFLQPSGQVFFLLLLLLLLFVEYVCVIILSPIATA